MDAQPDFPSVLNFWSVTPSLTRVNSREGQERASSSNEPFLQTACYSGFRPCPQVRSEDWPWSVFVNSEVVKWVNGVNGWTRRWKGSICSATLISPRSIYTTSIPSMGYQAWKRCPAPSRSQKSPKSHIFTLK